MQKTDYKAFISYAHKDEKFGKWLHKALENYKIPKELYQGNPNLPKKLFPIFRDREELSTSSNLGKEILKALYHSESLIIICSTKSAKSQWVNQEIIDFKRIHGENKVHAIIIDGEPHAKESDRFDDELECFPEALKYKVIDGKLSNVPTEPIAGDFRKGKDGKEHGKLKLISGLLGIGFDELNRREEKRKRRNRFVWSVITTTIISLISSLIVYILMIQNSLIDITAQIKKLEHHIRDIDTENNETIILLNKQLKKLQKAKQEKEDILSGFGLFDEEQEEIHKIEPKENKKIIENNSPLSNTKINAKERSILGNSKIKKLETIESKPIIFSNERTEISNRPIESNFTTKSVDYNADIFGAMLPFTSHFQTIGDLGTIESIIDLRGFVPMLLLSKESDELQWYEIPIEDFISTVYFENNVSWSNKKNLKEDEDFFKKMGDILENGTTKLTDKYLNIPTPIQEEDVYGEEENKWIQLAYSLKRKGKELFDSIGGGYGYDDAEPIMILSTEYSKLVFMNFRYKGVKESGQYLVAFELSKTGEYKAFYPIYDTFIVSINTVGTVKVTSNFVNVRSGAGIKYKSIGRIYKGERYSLIRINGNWIEISFEEKRGWVYKNLVRIETEAFNTSLPIIEDILIEIGFKKADLKIPQDEGNSSTMDSIWGDIIKSLVGCKNSKGEFVFFPEEVTRCPYGDNKTLYNEFDY